MRILVVDDDALAGEMTALVLEAAGHDPVVVENGIEAMRHLSEDEAVTLVVSDMNMPFVTGIELFRELRRQEMMIPFVLLTGDDAAPLLAEEPGLDACIVKDADFETGLPETVNAVLARRGRTDS